MRDMAERVVHLADGMGASYADCRVVQREREFISVKNAKIENLNSGDDMGVGVRVIVDGGWGFASTNRLDDTSLQDCVRRAVEIARSGARVRKYPVQLAAEPVYVDEWVRPVQIDPFTVDMATKLELLTESSKAMLKEGAKIARASLVFERDTQVFASSEGSLIKQVLTESGGSLYAMAVGKGHTQVRTYPCTVWHDIQGEGWETIEKRDLLGNAPRVGSEAVQLLSAPPCPEMTTDVIIAPNELALQIHESVGHAVEADRILGHEADLAGTSFIDSEMLGHYRFGSDKVNLFADPTIPGSRITYKYDDEGVKAGRVDLVKDGILVGLTTSRESAFELGYDRSGGCMRANNYDRIPLVRMPMVSLAPGDISYEDLIASTERGILLDQNRSWSIDDRRLNFQFGSEVGWLIEDGQITQMVRDPIYADITPAFWSRCDAIADEKDWRIMGYACGKGTPGQDGRVAHGCSHARFRGMDVGAKTS